MVATTFWVTGMMEVGAFKKEFVGTYTHTAEAYFGGGWGACAKSFSDNVKAWTNANAAQLCNRR